VGPDPEPVDAVQIWRVDLELEESRLAQFRALLSPEEIARADRFRFPADRRRFVASHGALRLILSTAVAVPAEHLLFTKDPGGKPRLAGRPPAGGVRFNLSHSGETALIALSRTREVGVDLEQIRPDRATAELARRYFSPAESGPLTALPPGERTAAFFACWARKEAYLKARGDGLRFPLERFTVSLGEPAKLLEVQGEPAECSRWEMYSLALGAEYAGAVVVERADREGVSILLKEYEPGLGPPRL